MLEQVLGQAFHAAEYHLASNELEQSRGLFRYHKHLPENLHGFVEIQHLSHPDLSRFRLHLIRTDQTHPRLESPAQIETTLAALLWHEFGVQLLESPDHWWAYRQPEQLGQELYQAGQLLFAYGIPWLEQTL